MAASHSLQYIVIFPFSHLEFSHLEFSHLEFSHLFYIP